MVITVSIYGAATACRLLAVHPFGTLDVERISDGKCFRVSGLIKEKRNG
jgi:hypothetical protein